MQIDVLIVGQGLAGSLLAWTLLEQDMSVLIVDAGAQNASQVAAGLINPVTGRRLVMGVDVGEILAEAMHCYRRLADSFKQTFFIAKPMLRVLSSSHEQNIAQQRLQQAEYRVFLNRYAGKTGLINNEFGVLEQGRTGYLATHLLLKTLREFFMASGRYRQASLDYQALVLRSRPKWRDIEARHIVFCEGHEAMQNPWFKGLPFQPAKGEILTCRSDRLPAGHILNFGHWLLPLQDNVFKLGATFEPGLTDCQVSEQARRQLLAAALKVMPGLAPISVLEQHAGVRPTTLDKQPFIGSHPQHPFLHIFNGFGAKGSLQIPWHAKQFALSLRQQSTIPAKAHINRYYETHFPG